MDPGQDPCSDASGKEVTDCVLVFRTQAKDVRMKDSVLRQVADLQNLSHEELKERWAMLYGGTPPAYNRTFIIKRLAHRIQELAHGGLSEKVRVRMREILDAHGFDENACDRTVRQTQRERMRRQEMPVSGTRLVREWNGRRHEVIVVPGGFEYEGRNYRSLTAITKVITGTHWNGRAFFGFRNDTAKKGANV